VAIKYKGVSGGTISGDPLCRTCSHSQYIQGSSLSQLMLHCDRVRDPLTFEAYECGQYEDKRLPSLYDMEQLAWVFVTNSKTKQIGFVSAKDYQKQRNEAGGCPDDILPK
jgi:hypothetical protein